MGGGGDGGMSAYFQAQQLELAKQAQVEQAKAASGNIKGASAAAEQKAALRRGIASTFNRDSAFEAPSFTGATSGSSAKLGN